MPLLQRVYAEALLKAAGKANAPEVYGGLAEFAGLCAESGELKDFLENPVIPSRQKKEILQKIFPSGFNETAINFVYLLVENKRAGLLPEILKYMYRLLPENKDKLFIKIFTAKQLDEKTIGEIKEKYSKQNSVEVEAEVITDSSLMGGICVQIGDMRYDGTLKTQLKRLREKLI